MTKYSQTTYNALQSNRWRSAFLLALFPIMLMVIVLLATVAFVLGTGGLDPSAGPITTDDALLQIGNTFFTAAPVVTVVALIWVFIALLSGKNMVLSFGGATKIKKSDAPELYRLVENMAIQTGIPTPDMYIIEDMSMNAFATGYSPNRAAIAATRGLLDRLDKTELEAVLAHEMGHILHRDTRVMLIAITMVGIVQLASELVLRTLFRSLMYGGNRDRRSSGNAMLIVFAAGIIIWLIGAIGAVFVQLGLSRRREFMADTESANITRHPPALISALQKISTDARVEVLDGKRTIASLCIADPLAGRKQGFFDSLSGLFSSHPPLQARVDALKALM